jgi:hypothetical protein
VLTRVLPLQLDAPASQYVASAWRACTSLYSNTMHAAPFSAQNRLLLTILKKDPVKFGIS